MDFDLPEEIRILRDTVRKFVDKELIPLERVYRHDSEGPTSRGTFEILLAC